MKNSISLFKQSLPALWLLSSLAFAATGPEVAQLLNTRYQNTTAECVGEHPAYFCSGVLVRGSEESGEFWKHGAIATQLGAENFNYLRADLGTRALKQKNGVVFSDAFTAIGQGKSLDALCVYPFEFAVTGTRPHFGCGAIARAEPDPSSCTAEGVTDAQGWLAHFQEQGEQSDKQCSFSSYVPMQFRASLIAHDGINDTWSASPNMVQIKNWDSDAPTQLPIQGLFYDMTQTGALLGAQKDQRDYFNVTGDWLPILRMDLHQAPDGVFGFNQHDQLYTGYEVASRLNARYADTSPACRGDTAAYNCNGVLIRATDVSTAFHSWNPSPQSVAGNGVSFSYARADTRIRQLFKTQGFVVRESFAPTGKPLEVRCIYPNDAHTGGSKDLCRVHVGLCAEVGVTTPEEWVRRYAANPIAGCAFDTEPDNFQLATTVRPTSNDPYGWNELIMAAWTESNPEQMPLEAFTINAQAANPGNGLAGAQFIQRDYFQVTGRFIPVVRVSFAEGTPQVFTYDPADQTVSGTVMQSLFNALPPSTSHPTFMEYK
jgi:hypothetical protein